MEDKYGEAETFESWADNNILIPISTRMVDPLYNLGVMPNTVTIISTLFTFFSIYCLHNDRKPLAGASYFLGAIFDSIDGRMARKYNITSHYGMVLDVVSDNLSNFILFGYVLLYHNKSKYFNMLVVLIIFMTYMLSFSYGINEAYSIYKKAGTDDFYKYRIDELDKLQLSGGIYDIYKHIMKTSYNIYRKYIPEYDEEKILKYLKVLKEFGPGNFCLLVSIIILYL